MALGMLVAGGYVGRQVASAQDDPPVPYSHKTHIEAGMQCLYCHTDAQRSPVANIPSVAKCMGCHESIAIDDEGVQVLTQYWEEGKPIPWEKVHNQPDFVYFSHQPHVNAGFNCENCHGDVAQMDLAEQVVEMDMGWCLDCHEHEAPDDTAHLWDCLVCHE
ncbi:MAG: cytochrome c3 family protein [Chloroflexi bacterium]|nr:cytochrome c3 family protein [Chloroflexota bacterium]